MPLTYFPDKIYHAETKYRKNKELWNALNQLEDKKGINKNWMLSDGEIFSFNDLNQDPWNLFVTKKVDFILMFPNK